MGNGIVSATEFQSIGGHPGLTMDRTIRNGESVPLQVTAGTRVTLDVGGERLTTEVGGTGLDPASQRALALDRLAREGNAAAKAELPAALAALKKGGTATQLQTLKRIGGANAPATSATAGLRGAGTLRALGPLGIFSSVLGAVADAKDAKDPAKVKAIADQIRRGELSFDMLPPFSPLTEAVRKELAAGEMA